MGSASAGAIQGEKKGVPRCLVPWEKDGDNIDLFPEGFLWERGCSLERGDKYFLKTPKGKLFHIQMWGSLPYITKNELNLILNELPETLQPGRSGHPAETPTAARVSRTEVLRPLRSQLKDLVGEFSKKRVQNI